MKSLLNFGDLRLVLVADKLRDCKQAGHRIIFRWAWCQPISDESSGLVIPIIWIGSHLVEGDDGRFHYTNGDRDPNL